jgi:serine/threonine protein kinase
MSATQSIANLHVGDVVDGRYELRRDLGRGAGGLVFEARHMFTGRLTALKVVAPDVPRAQLHELRARLTREARALAAVRHPGVVEVLDGGILADGTPYIVMEKLEGRTLEGLLAARGKVSSEDTVALALQLCDALDAAHKANIVHRDLKPGNLFIVRDREGNEGVKLVDFGIALVQVPKEEKLTGIGALIGTPAYMAPEQLLAMDDVDGRADTYALGVTMFECLTGEVPYIGSYQRVLLAACSEEPAPKVLASCPDAAPALAAVIERGMAKKREDRFASPADFARALRDAAPGARTRTFLLGPPPLPKAAAQAGPRPPAKPPEQRRAPRAPYTTPVSIILGGSTVDGRSEDISAGGLLVISRQTCPAKARVSARFALPIEGRVVVCEADVRWVRAAHAGMDEGPSAIGLEFVDPSAEIRASITRYVELMGDGKVA